MLIGLVNGLAQGVTGIAVETGILLGATAAGGLFNYFENRGLNKRREALIDQQIKFAEDQERIARGDFTSPERTQIEKGAEPILTQTAASVAARLGSRSPAGVKLVEQARGDAFGRVQSAAAGNVPLATSAALNSLNLIPGSSVAQDLGAIATLLTKSRDKNGNGNENGNGSGNAAEMNAMVNDLVSTFPSLRDQGYGEPRRMVKALRAHMNQ